MNRHAARQALAGHTPQFIVRHRETPKIGCSCGEGSDLWGFVEHVLDVLAAALGGDGDA